MLQLNQLRLGPRLAASYCVLLLLLCCATGYGIRGVAALRDTVVLYDENFMPSMAMFHEVGHALDQLRMAEQAHLRASTDAGPSLRQQHQHIVQRWQTYEQYVIDAEDRRRFEAVSNGLAAYGQQLGSTTSGQAYGEASAALQRYWDYATQVSNEVKLGSQQEYEHQVQWALVFTAAAVLIGALAAWRITRSVVLPVQAIADTVKAVAHGDFSRVSPVGGRDELALLNQDVIQMRDRLAHTGHTLQSSADTIRTAIVQISAANGDLSARTERQAAQLGQASQSMDTIADAARIGLTTAQQTDACAGRTKTLATQTRDDSQAAVAQMSKLEASIRGIAEVVSLIDGISHRTNLLALNAGVEAARAGEHGRGFGIVAGEVRQLAQRTLDAAKDIRGLIDQCTDQCQLSSKQVLRAGELSTQTLTDAEQISTLASEMTQISQALHEHIDAVHGTLRHLDASTQQNASMAEQMAAATVSVNEQATRLTTAASWFQNV